MKEVVSEKTDQVKIVLLAHKRFHLNPDKKEIFGGEVQITNISKSKITIEHHKENSSFLTFSSSKITELEPYEGKIAIMHPPLTSSEVEIKKDKLDPDETLKLTSWSRHLNMIEDFVSKNTRLDHSKIEETIKVRNFLIEYTLTFSIDGNVVNKTYSIPLEVIPLGH